MFSGTLIDMIDGYLKIHATSALHMLVEIA
jgi:hypothetical protein